MVLNLRTVSHSYLWLGCEGSTVVEKSLLSISCKKKNAYPVTLMFMEHCIAVFSSVLPEDLHCFNCGKIEDVSFYDGVVEGTLKAICMLG